MQNFKRYVSLMLLLLCAWFLGSVPAANAQELGGEEGQIECCKYDVLFTDQRYNHYHFQRANTTGEAPVVHVNCDYEGIEGPSYVKELLTGDVYEWFPEEEVDSCDGDATLPVKYSATFEDEGTEIEKLMKYAKKYFKKSK